MTFFFLVGIGKGFIQAGVRLEYCQVSTYLERDSMTQERVKLHKRGKANFLNYYPLTDSDLLVDDDSCRSRAIIHGTLI